jgi:hypothetical protein
MDGEGSAQVERGVQGQAAAGHLSVQFPMVLGTRRDVCAVFCHAVATI